MGELHVGELPLPLPPESLPLLCSPLQLPSPLLLPLPLPLLLFPCDALAPLLELSHPLLPLSHPRERELCPFDSLADPIYPFSKPFSLSEPVV